MNLQTGLDPLEDFLLSSAMASSLPSGTSGSASASNSTRIMGPPMSTTNLNGLNLSLNHGLDLTCPTYGCLNLTQSSQPHQHHQHQQQHHSQLHDNAVLNLTQPPTLPNSSSSQQQSLPGSNNSVIRNAGDNGKKMAASEVGLNLSIQNGMNLTRQAVQQQQQYYYGTQMDYSQLQGSGSGSNSATALSATNSHRNSPLNLVEQHRSSPLNLTAPVPQQSRHQSSNSKYDTTSGYFNFSNQQQQQQQQHHLGHQQQQQQHPPDGYTHYNEMLNFSSSLSVGNQVNQQQNFYNYDLNEVHYDYSNIDLTTTGSNGNNVDLSNPNQAGNAKIRLFCSTCCQEFGSSNELNKHMEKHNAQAEDSSLQIPLCSFCGQPSRDQMNHKHVCSRQQQQQQQQQQHQEWNQSLQGDHQGQNYHLGEQNFATPVSQTTSQSQAVTVTLNTTSSSAAPTSTSAASTSTSSRPSNSVSVTVTTKKDFAKPSTSVISNGKRKLAISKAKLAAALPPNNSTKKSNEPCESCNICSMIFPTGLDLKKHLDLAHRGRQNVKKYQCLQCAAEFDDVRSHQTHVDMHLLEKPFKCSQCGLHLTNASGLKRHVKRVHEKVGLKHSCKTCGKSFFEKSDLARHVKTHDVPRCEKCGKVNKNNSHVCKPPIPHNPDLICSICKVQLEDKIKWGYHMWRHTKDPAYIQTRTVVPDLPKVQNLKSKAKTTEASKEKENNPGVRKSNCDSSKTTSAAASTMVTATASSTNKKRRKSGLEFPKAPDAHATTYSQMGQPLCLQTSGSLVVAEELKPLNMQMQVIGSITDGK